MHQFEAERQWSQNTGPNISSKSSYLRLLWASSDPVWLFGLLTPVSLPYLCLCFRACCKRMKLTLSEVSTHTSQLLDACVSILQLWGHSTVSHQRSSSSCWAFSLLLRFMNALFTSPLSPTSWAVGFSLPHFTLCFLLGSCLWGDVSLLFILFTFGVSLVLPLVAINAD